MMDWETHSITYSRRSMEIKRIQLRGISRSPSDRMTEDGGVAESLNVTLDNSEIAPSIAPKDVTEDLGLVGNFERVFIHKTLSIENYIVVAKDEKDAYYVGFSKDGSVEPILELGEGEVVRNITSFGNTIGVTTDLFTYWALYKGGDYTVLGTKVPFPSFKFANYEVEGRDLDDTESTINVVRSFVISDSSTNNPSAVREFNYSSLQKSYDTNSPVKDEKSLSLLNEIWQKFAEAESLNREEGIFNHQVHAILAIKLIDESELISTPIVLSAGYNQPFEVNYTNEYSSYWEAGGDGENAYEKNEQTYYTKVSCKLRTAYKIFLKIEEENNFFEDWKDVIESINVYISTRVGANLPKDRGLAINAHSVTEEDSNVDEETGNGYKKSKTTKTASIELGDKDYDYEEQHLNASVFRLIKSYSIQDLETLTRGTIVDMGKEAMSDDYIPEKLDFSKASMVNYHTTFSKSVTFNSRLIAFGIQETKEIFAPSLNAVNFTNKRLVDAFVAPRPEEYASDGIEQYFNLTFYLRDNDGKELVLTARHPVVPANSRLEYVKYGDNIEILDIDTYANVFEFIICPDKRAYKVDVSFDYFRPGMGGVQHASIAHLSLKEHPYLNCSYYYGGMEKNLVNRCRDYDNDYITGPTQVVEEVPNKIYVSEMDSPFVFPLASRYTFQSEVLGVAIASTALSQGQFGQYPLYVFTKDGIWAMETSATGDLLSSKPLSREVCANPNSITSLDQSVVFVTAKGVMLLSGSQVVELSPFMNGKHYMVEEGAKELIKNQCTFCDLLPAISDNTHFLAFVKEASIAYDYSGKRLIFIKPDEKYQYVYKLDTQTWHKVAYGLNFVAPLNSYPECLVQGEQDGNTRVYDLSTNLDAAANDTPARAIIATRPFDLAEPDVFKTIRDVRVRGQFPRGAVKFILLGSNDGIHFSVISTLRGKSWKLFRLIILADLDATDRISWVDVGYETRFTNKLR